MASGWATLLPLIEANLKIPRDCNPFGMAIQARSLRQARQTCYTSLAKLSYIFKGYYGTPPIGWSFPGSIVLLRFELAGWASVRIG